MELTKNDASQALGEIAQAQGRMREVTAYANASPFLILWGAAWLVADTAITVTPPSIGQWIWPVISAAFVVLSIVVGMVQGRRRAAATGIAHAQASDAGKGRQQFASGVAVFVFLAALIMVMGPLNAKQSHSLFGIFFGFAYALGGIWTGWRLILLGLLLGGLTLVGFYFVAMPAYLIYMGVVGGGALILGGLWLYKV